MTATRGAAMLLVLSAALGTFGARAPVAPTVQKRYEDFVGAEVCGECHRPELEAWLGSPHGRAGGSPSPETVIAPFDGTPIRFRDAVVVPTITPAGDYVFRVEREEREPQTFVVDGVLGRGHMVGGGTQGFLARFPDGTVRLLPFDFSRDSAVWFCNTTHIPGQWTSTGALASLRAGKGWVPVTRDMRLTDCGDWPPVRILGTDERMANCQGCHGSRITVQFDTASRLYRTRIGSLAIDCESCHGPGREHVELARSGKAAQSPDLRIGVLDTLDTDASLQVCFRCHALKHVLEPDYLPGRPFETHFALLLPLVGAHPLHPDGRVRTFAYQQNHRASECYLNGSMKCVDCHEPHAQRYRTVTGQSLSGRFSDEQCLGCHPSKQQDPSAHTHHAPASPGARCVACHMPYLQQPEVGHRIRYGRSDHTISIPRPADDADLGLRSACAGCHPDRPTQALEERTREWYGQLKPRNPVVAELLRATRANDSHITLNPGVRHPVAQVMSLDYLLQNVLVRRLLRPDTEGLEPGLVRDLEALAANRDPDVRAVALAALQLAAGDDASERAFLRSALQRDTSGDVRARWVLALGLTAEAYRARGSARRAIIAYTRALEVAPGDPESLLGLAVALDAAGDDSAALDAYRGVIASKPSEPIAWINLGLELEKLGNLQTAEYAYRRAVVLNPNLGLPRMNLGNLLLRRGEHREAIEQYRLAVAVEPWLARAYFYLAVAYVQDHDREKALDALRHALEFAPDDEEVRSLYGELVRDRR